LLSVVTICRNDADGLRRTLSSLAGQDVCHERWESVVVDGASDDGSAEVARSFANLLPLRLVSEPDEGIYDAMNKGFRLATASWVQFLNAGDTYAAPESLRMLCDAAEATHRRWLVARTAFLAPDGSVSAVSTNVPHRRWRHALGLSMHAHPSTLMRRDLLAELGGFETAEFGSAADFDLVLRAGRLAGRPESLDAVVVRFEPAGTSGDNAYDVPRLLQRIRRARLRLGPIGRAAEGAYSAVFARRWEADLRRSRR
jgi:glycosyltransferase involved in cell wall biosynthesis